MNIDTNAINAVTDKIVSLLQQGTEAAVPVAKEVITQY